MFSIVPFLQPVYHIDQVLFGFKKQKYDSDSENSTLCEFSNEDNCSSVDYSPVLVERRLGEGSQLEEETPPSPQRRLFDNQGTLVSFPLSNEKEGDLRQQAVPVSHSPLLIVDEKEGVAETSQLPKQSEATTSLSSQHSEQGKTIIYITVFRV